MKPARMPIGEKRFQNCLHMRNENYWDSRISQRTSQYSRVAEQKYSAVMIKIASFNTNSPSDNRIIEEPSN